MTEDIPRCHVCAEDALYALGVAGMVTLCANVVCQIVILEQIKEALNVQGES